MVGDVEVAGSKGFCKMEVKATYDPKGDTYVRVVAYEKLVSDRWQRPKGGR